MREPIAWVRERNFNFDALGGRTFLMTLGCGIATSVMRWFDKLDNPTYGLIITSSVCVYIAQNGFTAFVNKRAEVQTTIAKVQAEAGPPNTAEQVQS